MAVVTPANIKWYTYGSYEGSSFIGRVPYVPPTENLSFSDKLLAITVAAEGGHFDSINMWDSGRMSVGLIQFIDVAPQFGVSKMLSLVADRCGPEAVSVPLEPALKMSNAVFKKNPSGQWRFFLDGGMTEVKTIAQQEKLYFAGPNQKGSFTQARVLHAKTWAACMANIWENKDACKVQEDFTVPQLGSFSFGAGRDILLNPNDNPGDEGWPGAIKAFYMAYAINLPTKASQMVALGAATSKFAKWSPEWCLDIMHCFVFSGNIGVWNGRYNAKRPWLEKMFGIVMPKDVTALSKKSWHVTPPPPATPSAKTETSVERPVGEVVKHSTDVVVSRPDIPQQQPTAEDGMFMKVLQWFPLILGFGWRFVSWVVSYVWGVK